MQADYAIIGGGIVGLSVAWGLLGRGHKVIVIDGEDGAFRASRGNFGLVWVQSKGMNQPRYAEWSQGSAAAWAGYAAELAEETGRDIPLDQNGGLDLHFSDETLEKTVAQYETLKSKLGGNYPYEILRGNALRREEPHLGPKAGKVVVTAGLGAAQVGPQLGFKAPVRPQRGQVLITEKLPKMINRPSLIARQVDEGGIQIGATNEEVGHDDRVTTPGVAHLAAEAVAAYPFLARAQLVRSWAALRILTPDGLPIYQQSREMPGAYLVTCHSGITLSAAHARFLPEWLDATEAAPNLEVFSEDRFTL